MNCCYQGAWVRVCSRASVAHDDNVRTYVDLQRNWAYRAHLSGGSTANIVRPWRCFLQEWVMRVFLWHLHFNLNSLVFQHFTAAFWYDGDGEEEEAECHGSDANNQPEQPVSRRATKQASIHSSLASTSTLISSSKWVVHQWNKSLWVCMWRHDCWCWSWRWSLDWNCDWGWSWSCICVNIFNHSYFILKYVRVLLRIFAPTAAFFPFHH